MRGPAFCAIHAALCALQLAISNHVSFPPRGGTRLAAEFAGINSRLRTIVDRLAGSAEQTNIGVRSIYANWDELKNSAFARVASSRTPLTAGFLNTT